MSSIQLMITFEGSTRDIKVIKEILENEDSQSEFTAIICDAVAKTLYEASPLKEKSRDMNISVSPVGTNPLMRHLMEKQRDDDEARKAKDNWKKA